MKARARRAALALVLAAAPAIAQEPEPRFSDLVRAFQREALSLGVLFQVVADVQNDRNQAGRNGFVLANARLRVSGQLDEGFEYLLRVNFAESPGILDARIGYRVAPALTIHAGQFKAPFSREFLTGAGGIDFVNRSQVVTALAPNRQVGAQVGGRTGSLEYAAGAFNGNPRTPSGNDNEHLLYVGRISLWPGVATPDRPEDRLEIGVNAASSRDAAANVGVGFVPGFAGARTLVGADARWQRGRWLAAAEGIRARLAFAGGPTRTPSGYHGTVGFMARPGTQLLARIDDFRPDGLGADQQLVILGLNVWPTRPTEVQFNGVVPTNRGGLRRPQLLVNLQVAF